MSVGTTDNLICTFTYQSCAVMRNEATCINAAARVASRAVVVRKRQIRVVVSATTVVSAVGTRMDDLCASVHHSTPVGTVVCYSH